MLGMSDKRLQRSIDVSPNSYLDEVANGRRSSYVRTVIDIRLTDLAVGARQLALVYSVDKIESLILDANLPRREQPRGIDLIPELHRRYVCGLAMELELTRLDLDELLMLLEHSTRA